MAEIYDLVCQLHSAGYSVIPTGGGPDGKRPLIQSWKEYQTRKPTGAELYAWQQELSPRSWAVVCGSISGVIVIDADSREAVDKLATHNLQPHIDTPKGGHYYVQYPGYPVKPAVRAVDGIDIRGDGSYCLFVGTRPDGGEYQVKVLPGPGMLREITDFPEDIQRAINNGSKPKRTAAKALSENIPAGERNDRLTSIAGAMRRQGTTPEAILAALLEVNQAQCEPPLPDSEVEAIAGSIGRYQPGASSKREYNQSDSGMGERLADMYRDRIRFVHLWGQWLIYRGGCWYPDNIGEVKLLAKLAVRSMYAGAADIESKEERKKYLDYVLGAESERRINAALIMAASEKGIATNAADLDAQPWLLNVKNGTINLNTCTLRPHNPGDLLTQIADVDYDPAATSGEWDTFLTTVFDNDPELIEYIRRAVGYTLNGTQNERVFYFCYGLGRNGKSQFLTALRQVLGPYATEAKPDVFMETRFKTPGPDEGLAALRGIRLLTATEVKKGHAINTGLIKRMTGGEPLWHERKFQHGYSFQPTHTLWLSGNHEPRIKDTTDSIWDRLKKIPFNVRISEAQDIKAYGEKLAKTHGPAILAWMIKGAREWNQEGLVNEPDIVKTAISEYRAHQDMLHDFVSERVQKTPGNNVTVADMYAAYCDWCKENDQDAVGKRTFNDAMRERGYRDQRGTGNKPVWVSVTLVTSVTNFTESSTTARAREELLEKTVTKVT